MTTERICKNCYYWELAPTAKELGVDWTICDRLSNDEEEQFTEGFGYDEDSWLDRGIETKSDFGCILWKEREEEKDD